MMCFQEDLASHQMRKTTKSQESYEDYVNSIEKKFKRVENDTLNFAPVIDISTMRKTKGE